MAVCFVPLTSAVSHAHMDHASAFAIGTLAHRAIGMPWPLPGAAALEAICLARASPYVSHELQCNRVVILSDIALHQLSVRDGRPYMAQHVGTRCPRICSYYEK